MLRKLLIIIGSLLFAAFIAVELYLQSDAFSDKVKPHVVGPLRELLGAEVRIGKIKANLLPFSAEARNISVWTSPDREVAAVRKVRIIVSPFSLLVKKISLPAVTIIRPRIMAERDEQGALDLDPIIQAVQAALERSMRAGPARYQVRVRTVSVTDGQAHLVDRAARSRIELSGLTLQAKLNLPADQASATLRVGDIRKVLESGEQYGARLRGAATYERGNVHIASLELESDDARCKVTGAVGTISDPLLDVRIACRIGPQSLSRYAEIFKKESKGRGPSVDMTATIKGAPANPSVEGKASFAGITLFGMTLKDAAVSFGYQNRLFRLVGQSWRVLKANQSITIDRINAELAVRGVGIDIKQFELLAGDLTVRGAGRVDMAAGLDVSLVADSTDAGKTLSFASGISVAGKVSVKGVLSGPTGSPRFEGDVAASRATVRGVAFDEVAGKLRYGEQKILLSAVSIHHGASRYLFDGAVDLGGPQPLYSAKLTVSRSDVVSIVALFYEPIPLELSATGELSFYGTSADFTGRGHLDLDAGRAYGESFTSGALTAVLTSDRITFSQLILHKGGGVITGSGWIGFDGAYGASLQSRAVDLAAVDHLEGMPVGGSFSLDIESSGSFSKPGVKASLRVPKLEYFQAELGGFGADLAIEDGRLSASAGLDQERTAVRGSMKLAAPYAWNLDAAVKSDGIDPFLAVGHKDLFARVRIIAEGAVRLRGQGMNLSALSGNIDFDRLSVIMGEYRVDSEGAVSAVVSGNRVTLTSVRFIGPETSIALSGKIDLMKEYDLAVTGAANLSLLRMFYREVEHGDGAADATITIKDAWASPIVSGELRLKNGVLKIRDVPQKFTNLNGTVTVEQGRIIAESLTGEVGGGSISASGWIQLQGTALQSLSLKAVFANVTVRYPEGLTSTLSGDLFYDGDPSEQMLAGEVIIKRARYEKRVEWKSMLVDFSRGFYQRKKTDVGWIGDTRLNVRFRGADNIVLQNNLAKVPLEIDMMLRGTVNKPQVLGRIEARKGTVYFRRNEFKITHASVDFIDQNRLNPLLDVQAEIQIREYRIRLAVSGKADHAVVTLISDPSLTDQDILSLLALGRKGEELKGRETGVGVGEATSLATGQFQDVLERRTRSLTGLDRFQIDPAVTPTDTAVPRVTVGKELVQDKLYVTYSSNVGASAPEQVFRIEYLLNRNVSLVGARTETGSLGADVKFRFEFK